MTLLNTRRRSSLLRGLLAWVVGCAVFAAWNRGEAREVSEEFLEVEESLSVGGSFGESRSLMDEVLPPGDESADGSHFVDPDAESVSQFDPVLDGNGTVHGGSKEHLRPFDYMRHWGFHHSSTEGRFVDKNVPLNFSSWLNRPFHVDWFVGPLLSDSPDKSNLIRQTNELFGGLRFGWDFDYYWGTEWRFGWADPQVFYEGSSDRQPGQYFVSDVNILYYPWGDTRVRPFFVGGLGVSEIGSIHRDGGGLEATLLGMPFGMGVQFQQTPWMAWRAEIMDNLAWGSEGVSTTHNVSFTAGMEIRYGARKPSYWPWRTSRNSW